MMVTTAVGSERRTPAASTLVGSVKLSVSTLLLRYAGSGGSCIATVLALRTVTLACAAVVVDDDEDS